MRIETTFVAASCVLGRMRVIFATAGTGVGHEKMSAQRLTRML